jgi:hypothetical protein
MRAHAILLDATHRLLRVNGALFGVEAEGARLGIAFSDDAEIEYEHVCVLRVFQRAG